MSAGISSVLHLRTDLSSFDDRLRNVEVSFGQVDQRLMTIERVTVLSESIQQWMNAVVGETLAAGPPPPPPR